MYNFCCLYFLNLLAQWGMDRIHHSCLTGGWVWVDRPERGNLVLLSIYVLLANLKINKQINK